MPVQIATHQYKFSEKHQVMFRHALKSLTQLTDRTGNLADIPKIDNTFSPYGLDFGCGQKEILSKIKYFKKINSYYLSTRLNCLYKVYFVDISIENLSFTGQFHLINDHFFLAHTSFTRPLFAIQYERLLKGLIGYETIPGEMLGVLPCYLRDTNSCLLKIHNYTGYPSFSYYLECNQIKAKMMAMLEVL